MRKFKKWLMVFAMAAGVLSSTAMTAFAYTGDTGQTETTGEAAAGETQPVIPEQDNAGGRFLGGGQTVVHQGFDLFDSEVPAAHLIQHPAEVLLPFQPEQSPGMTL